MASEKLQGTAVIIGSNMDPDHDPTDPEGQRDDSFAAELLYNAVGTLYEFTLEVTVPGHDPYQVSGIRSRVPTKAQRLSLINNPPIPITLEVPVVVKVGDAERVVIDWKAFIAYPDRVERLKAARERALQIAAQRHAERMAAQNPQSAASPPGQNPAMVWAEAVRAGNLTRKQFDESTMRLLTLGQLSNADYLAAEARLNEP